MKYKKGKTLALLLALALLVGLLPGMGITAYALELSEALKQPTSAKRIPASISAIPTTVGADGDGIYCRAASPVRIEATNGDMITRVELTIGSYGGYDRRAVSDSGSRHAVV